MSPPRSSRRHAARTVRALAAEQAGVTGQRRLTSPLRIRQAAEARADLRWRALVLDLCLALKDGVHSALERRYDRHVERPHGLPRAERNVR